MSYAHEDLEAAQRLADGLRRSGLEVWFDQDELRGGDTWDQKIRRQIKDCALFLPVISRNTESRGEAYFRLEWKLAAERTHLMADGLPLIIPVAVDDVREAEAKVPAEFLKVQWTRLPGGKSTPRFIEQVQRLLTQPAVSSASFAPQTAPTTATPRPTTPKPTARAVWIGIAATALVAITAGLWWKDSPAANPAPTASPKAANTAPALPPIPTDKSIAVLPFTNASADGASASFISDGIQEEILMRLRQIGALRVPSIDSVNAYRDTAKSNDQIAAELKVAYLVKGTVRRAGETIQITCRLIDVRSGNEVVIGPLVEDQVTVAKLIATQARVAQQIAAELKTTLTPEEKARVERRGTDNTVAYEQYLKARQARRGFGLPGENARAMQPFLVEVVRLDPNFAEAYAEQVYAYALDQIRDAATRQATLAKADAAVDQLRRLVPDSPEFFLALGDYYIGTDELARAIDQYERYAKVRPKDSDGLTRLAEAYMRKPDWAKALTLRRTVEELDPGNLGNLFRLVQVLYVNRRFAEAEAVQTSIVARLPDNLEAQHFVGYMRFFATGETAPQNRFWEKIGPKALTDDISQLNFRRTWARITGNLDEAVRLDREFPIGTDIERVNMAIVHAVRGDLNAAKERLGNLPERLRSKAAPTEADLINRGTIEAILGNKAAALRDAAAAEAAIKLAGPGDPRLSALINGWADPADPVARPYYLARLNAWAGQPAKAIAGLAAILPTAIGDASADILVHEVAIVRNVHALRKHPDFAPIQSDPEFLKLLADPKNNAPLL